MFIFINKAAWRIGQNIRQITAQKLSAYTNELSCVLAFNWKEEKIFIVYQCKFCIQRKILPCLQLPQRTVSYRFAPVLYDTNNKTQGMLPWLPPPNERIQSSSLWILPATVYVSAPRSDQGRTCSYPLWMSNDQSDLST